MSYLLKEDGGKLLKQDNGGILLDELAGPGGLSATARTKANILSQTPGGSAKPVETIGYAWLTWTASSFGAQFAYYEVDRVGRNGGSIAHVTIESKLYFADFECPRNTALQYRVRSVNKAGQASPWLTFPTVTVPMDECVLTLANNAAPNEAFACEDMTPYDYRFSNEERVLIRNIAGRDVPMGFRPVEKGGDVFTRTIIVAGLGANLTNAAAGRVLLEPVLTLIRDPTLPYVAVADGLGWTWLTTPKISDSRRSEQGGIYTATIAFAETSTVSFPFTTPDPWHF